MGYVLILGAKSDMAKATAREYAQNGYDLILAGRDITQLSDFVRDIKIRYSIAVELLEFDVLDYPVHHSFYHSLTHKPDGVISFIGYLGDHELAKQNNAEAINIIDTNYTGLVSILNIVASDFEQKGDGFIIGVSSVAGERGRQSNYYYGSAKAGFTAFLSGLRNRLSQSGVHVMTVKPGFVYTKMTEHLTLPPALTAKPEQVAKTIYKSQQKKRNTIYVLWMWKWIMMVIKLIPERIFKKMKL